MTWSKFAIIIYLIWFLSELLINRMLRANTSADQQKDKGSLSMIWIVIIIANIAAVMVSLNISAHFSNG